MTAEQETVEELARRINANYAGVTKAFRMGLEYARRTGALLVKAKGMMNHGQWMPWCAKNLQLDPSTITRWMEIAREWPRLEKQYGQLKSMTVIGVIRLLRAERAEAKLSAAAPRSHCHHDGPRVEGPDQVQSAKLASTGDVAEMCLSIIRAARDPRAVAERLLPELQRIKNAPPAKRNSFEE